VQFSANLTLQLDSPMSGCPDTKACPPAVNRIFPVPPGRQVGYGFAN